LFTFVCGVEIDGWTAPSTSPKLTGSLDLRIVAEGIGSITRRLLELPDGLNFTKLVLTCIDATDFKFATDLVSGCSDTLESLSVTDYLPGVFPSIPMPDKMPYRHT